MSTPKAPKPAKLVTGIILRDKELIEKLVNILAERFGTADIISRWFSFDYTHYYEPEMGSPLFRRMLAFKALVDQEKLSEIKTYTNYIESVYSEKGKRTVNIDPGYMLCERFVLATGKNYTHRIYIGSNIYADLTLIYQDGGFKKLPWTYPDYSDDNMMDYLNNVRSKYITDLKRKKDK
jgi:hypothetical protein